MFFGERGKITLRGQVTNHSATLNIKTKLRKGQIHSSEALEIILRCLRIGEAFGFTVAIIKRTFCLRNPLPSKPNNFVEGRGIRGLCCQGKIALEGFQEERHIVRLFDFAFFARFPKLIDRVRCALFVIVDAETNRAAFVQADTASIQTRAVLANDTGDDLIWAKHGFHSLNGKRRIGIP